MVDTGEVHGLHPVTAFLVRMDEPLGHAVGNWLEVQECIHVLNGTFTALNQDLVRLTVVLAAQMLYQAGRFPNETMEELAQKALAALKNGRALAKFREMVMAQGGDCSVMDDPGSYPFVAAHRQTVRAAKDGYVAAVDALVVGQVSVLLGAGRKTKGDPIDPCAGILVFVKVGQQISKGAIVAELYTNTSETVLQTATARIVDCIQYSDHPVTVPPIVSHRVTKERGTEAFTMPALDW